MAPLFSDGRKLFTVIDEAQILLQCCKDAFSAVTSEQAQTRSLFTKVVHMWSEFDPIALVISGTGLRLKDATKYVTSATMKNTEEPTLMVDFGGYYAFSIWKGYVSQFLGDCNDGMLENVFSFMKGITN